MVYIVMIFVVFLLILIGYGRYYEPNQLEVKHVEVSNTLGFKIVHISDIHFGRSFTIEHLSKVVKEINSLHSEIVVFSGDLFANTFKGDTTPLIEELSKINVSHKYAVWGNHDYKKFAKENFTKVLTEAGFTVLKDEEDVVDIDGKIIKIVGTDDFRDGNPDLDLLHSLHIDESHDYNILIVHEPDAADEFVQNGYQLVMSGHTHGGQVRLPGDIRGTSRGGRNYIDGLYRLNNDTNLYVSSGLGNSVTRFRFRVTPSITILNI